jgi:UDP-2-acetamido-2-deoxy-ribo-hexuluronate aminotransferase
MTKIRSMQSIPFIDLRSQQLRIAPRLAALTAEVLERCDFIGGTFISRLETALAERAGVIQCIACASGTDALILALMALGMKPGERVICPSYTFAATAEAVALLHGIPVFVDVDPDTRNLDPVALRVLLEAEPGTFRGIIAVDIFGQPANYAAINELADTHGLWVIADAAQSFGARSVLGQVGSLATITTTSFYPAKPLGCYGDGGALFTADEALAQRLRSLRNHGQSQQRYLYDAVGLCSRLGHLAGSSATG